MGLVCVSAAGWDAAEDEGFLLGALRPLRRDGRDARFCIENRFTLFARFCRLQIGRAGHGDNLARSLFVQLNPCAEQVLRPPAEIQARIRRCRDFGIADLIVYPRAEKEKQGGYG